MPDWEKYAGNDEVLPVTHHNDVYPAIDPQPLYDAQVYNGKVVLVTGASRGIGQEIALQYARAGAALAIVARSEDALGETKTAILEAVPSAEVLVVVADVRDPESAERAVQALLARFGRLDILVANAGAITPIKQSAYCTPPLLF
jgi:NAD(P)-dependent dehydrogenase (short-subunit alcohol dehydrogenase family)